MHDFENIKFDEKMTVYALGYFIAYIMRKYFENVALTKK